MTMSCSYYHPVIQRRALPDEELHIILLCADAIPWSCDLRNDGKLLFIFLYRLYILDNIFSGIAVEGISLQSL